MKVPQMIVTIVLAITFGYIGSQYLTKNIMYIIGGGMIGVGAVGYIVPPQTKEKPTHTQPKKPAETSRH
jgi:F0F1-type ATP synthase assembly protein I